MAFRPASRAASSTLAGLATRALLLSACFILLMASGCACSSHRPSRPPAAGPSAQALARLRVEFDAVLPEAAADYCEEAGDNLQHLEQAVESALQAARQELHTSVLDLDGYVARIRRLHAGTDPSPELLRIYRQHLAPPLEAFATVRAENHSRLQARLLIHIEQPAPPTAEQAIDEAPFRDLADALTSKTSYALKLADEAVEWIPIAGDMYGMAKIFYCPRERCLVRKADETACQVRSILASRLLAELRSALPDQADVAARCRSAFSPPMALSILREQNPVTAASSSASNR